MLLGTKNFITYKLEMDKNMNEVKKNSVDNISILKNLALIFVLLGYAGCIYAGKWQYSVVNKDSQILKYITEYIYSFHMPLFVFISGYIYNYNRECLGKYNSTKNFIFNKLKRLIIPYFLVSITFMIPLQMIFSIYADEKSYIYRIINDTLLAQRPSHLWYLLMLFNLFIIFRIIEKK